jgi:hypothetical protein
MSSMAQAPKMHTIGLPIDNPIPPAFKPQVTQGTTINLILTNPDTTHMTIFNHRVKATLSAAPKLSIASWIILTGSMGKTT